jgi:hypothetical protein
MANSKSLLKSAPKKKKPVLPRGIDGKHLGPEPVWEDSAFLNESELRVRMMEALNWYNYFFEPKEARKWIVEYMQEVGMPKNAIAAFGKVPDMRMTNSLSALCRMISNGYSADEEERTKINAKIIDLCKLGANLANAEQKEATYKVSTSNPLSDLIGEVEGMIDDHSESLDDFYQWLKNRAIKPTYSTAIANYYRPWLEELLEAFEGTDDQLKEGYRHLNKKQLKQKIMVLNQMIEDCETYVGNNRKKVVRKPRKIRVAPAEKIVARMKFQKEDTSLKIVSIDPAKIIGARELWVFNTKYNILAHYVAETDAGLSVKGTTLQNVSDSSKQKKLRKPEQMLPGVLQGTSKAAERSFAGIKTKEGNPNGRINEFTVILRAIK